MVQPVPSIIHAGPCPLTTEAAPSAPVAILFVGWRELDADADGSNGIAGRRFQFIGEFQGDPPAWPLNAFFNGGFTLTRTEGR